MPQYLQKISHTIYNLELDEISPILVEALANGEGPLALLNAMNEGMTRVGDSFESGEYFLAELVLAGEMMKEGVATLEPLLKKEARSDKGTVVLCTVQGDFHDIGKNLVGIMLSSAGFKVIDLGVDVPACKVAEAVRNNSADAVALSVLLTTMVPSIGDVVSALEEEGLREHVKIAIGGACTTPELAETIGADACGTTAVDAVKIMQSWMDG